MSDHDRHLSAHPTCDDSKRTLAQRFLPVLVLWPEIPAIKNAPASLRAQYARKRQLSVSHTTAGAHITRDFHPRDVRLILDHAQAWEPRPPLPMVPIGIMRLYRDFARFFFWPIASVVIFALLVIALAQDLSGSTRTNVEVGTLIFLASVYLATLRSPIFTPVDHWHHLNHLVVSAGLIVTWLVTFGTGGLWYIGLIVAVPSVLLVITSLIIRAIGEFASYVIWPIRWLRSLVLWVLNRHSHVRPRFYESRVIQGLKLAHEYTSDGELFFRHPHSGKTMHRSDRVAFWSAYSRILTHQADKYPVTCYARVLGPNADGLSAIQYWFCYYYDDWANTHESDWETAIVIVHDTTPVAVAASAHGGGELREWNHVEVRHGRPVLYVAAGSHAFYFQPGSYLAERAIAGLRITSVDATLFGREMLDYVDFTASPTEHTLLDNIKVVCIPEPNHSTGLWHHDQHDTKCTGNCEHNFEWLNYEGHWGSVGVSLTGGFTGPRGPAASGLVWANPYLWAKTVCRPCSVCNSKPGNHAFQATQ